MEAFGESMKPNLAGITSMCIEAFAIHRTNNISCFFYSSNALNNAVRAAHFHSKVQWLR